MSQFNRQGDILILFDMLLSVLSSIAFSFILPSEFYSHFFFPPNVLGTTEIWDSDIFSVKLRMASLFQVTTGAGFLPKRQFSDIR